VDVVRLNLQGQHRPLQLGGLFLDECLQPPGNVTSQDRPPELGTPDKVIVDVINTASMGLLTHSSLMIAHMFFFVKLRQSLRNPHRLRKGTRGTLCRTRFPLSPKVDSPQRVFSMEPQEEAIQVFAKVIDILTSSNKDLKASLRLCQHACDLLDWGPQRQWFYNEVTGYSAGTTIPSYRRIQGNFQWQHKGSISEAQ
jgi:hypothetical protein